MSARTSCGDRPTLVGTARPVDDAALEARDAHHEELVEVAGEDGQEVRTFEKRRARIFGELEHALVEGEPAQLAIEISVLGQIRIETLRLVEVVVVRIAEARRRAPLVRSSSHHLQDPGDAGVNAARHERVAAARAAGAPDPLRTH